MLKIKFMTNDTELIKKTMSILGKRSAKVNKRDYSAMGKKGGWPKGKKRKIELVKPTQ